MVNINIFRKKAWMNKFRAIDILIDGKSIGSVKEGKVFSFILIPGKHKIKATIDWISSPEQTIECKENEEIYLVLESFSFTSIENLLFVFATLIWFLSFFIDIPFYIEAASSTILFYCFLKIIYLLTIGKKSYLTLNVKA
jgi:hypothetical protein